MTCPSCQQPVSDAAVTCPNCSADLVDVTIGAGGPEAAPPSRRPSWLVFGGAAVAVLAVGLAAWGLVRPATAGAELDGRFPAETVFFAEIDVAELTSADSRALVEAFAPMVETSTGEPFDLDSLIDDAIGEIEAELGDIDLSFEDDIASWATGPIAVGMLATDSEWPDRTAVIVGGDDAGALDAFLAKWPTFPGITVTGSREIDGATFQVWESDDGPGGVVGRHGTDLIVATDEATATSVISPTAGATLEDVPQVAEQMAQLPGNTAVIFAVNGSELAPGVNSDRIGFGVGWTTGAVTTERRGVRVDFLTDLGDTPFPSSSAELTGALPADTIAFFRINGVLDQVRTLMLGTDYEAMAEEFAAGTGLSIEEVMNLFAVDGGIAVWPSTEPELPVHAALVGVSDSSQAGLVDKIADLVTTMAVPVTPVDGGYSVAGMAAFGARGNLTILTTERDLLASAPPEPFAEGPLARKASELVDGDLVFALDVPAVIDLVDGLVGMDDPESAEILRCLPLGVAAGGMSQTGDSMKATTFLEIENRC